MVRGTHHSRCVPIDLENFVESRRPMVPPQFTSGMRGLFGRSPDAGKNILRDEFLYLIVDANQIPIYAGKAVSLYIRVAMHMKNSYWQDGARLIPIMVMGKLK